jgi:hypothetical protein
MPPYTPAHAIPCTWGFIVIKRWLKKREFMIYYMLGLYAKSKGEQCFNEGELLYVILPAIGSKRVARNIIRHLIRQGLLERKSPLYYCVRSFDEVFTRALAHYIAGRLRRRGIDCTVEDGKIIVSRDYCSLVEHLIRLGIAECRG